MEEVLVVRSHNINVVLSDTIFYFRKLYLIVGRATHKLFPDVLLQIIEKCESLEQITFQIDEEEEEGDYDQTCLIAFFRKVRKLSVFVIYAKLLIKFNIETLDLFLSKTDECVVLNPDPIDYQTDVIHRLLSKERLKVCVHLRTKLLWDLVSSFNEGKVMCSEDFFSVKKDGDNGISLCLFSSDFKFEGLGEMLSEHVVSKIAISGEISKDVFLDVLRLMIKFGVRKLETKWMGMPKEDLEEVARFALKNLICVDFGEQGYKNFLQNVEILWILLRVLPKDIIRYELKRFLIS